MDHNKEEGLDWDCQRTETSVVSKRVHISVQIKHTK